MAHGDMMVGPGGVARFPKSESKELARALALLDEMRGYIVNDNMLKAESALARVEMILHRLRGQVGEGYHVNPYTPFRVVGVIGKDVHTVSYQHAKDGKNYRHDFKRGSAQAIAVERHGKREILITGDVPLWEEF